MGSGRKEQVIERMKRVILRKFMASLLRRRLIFAWTSKVRLQ